MSATPPATARQHGGVSPLLVAGIAVPAVVVALIVLRSGSDSSSKLGEDSFATNAVDAPTGACGGGQPDPTYSVSTDSDPNPPRPEGTTFHLTVRREGNPVIGAKACLAAEMPSMQHAGLSKVAKETSGGR